MSEKHDTTALYRHWNADGELLYVGISLSALGRLQQHNNASHWANQIARVTIETFDTRDEAAEAERLAIANENPKHNIVGAANDNRIVERVRRPKTEKKVKGKVFAPDQLIERLVLYAIEDEMAGPVTNGRSFDEILNHAFRGPDNDYDWKQRDETRSYLSPTDEQIARCISNLALRGEVVIDGNRAFLPSIGDYFFRPVGSREPFFPRPFYEMGISHPIMKAVYR